MFEKHYFKTPFTDPVLVFTLVLFIVLLAPVVLKKFRIPSIIGLIIAGIAIGPHGFHLLDRDQSIKLFGTVGLLYIMFLAGLELDLMEFRKNRGKSILFGVFTFIIPFAIGWFVCSYFLQFSPLASLLVSSMFATHTLISYPVASRLGISKHEVVAIAVGGTIITDTLVLLLLALITSAIQGKLNVQFGLQLLASLSLFSLIIFWGFPLVGRWFFKNFEGEKTSHYVFVLAMVFLAGFLSELAGIEPIIGAFMAGLALNRLIPSSSMLMNRIEFVGNALFIPFFLISVGMVVDLRVFLQGNTTLIIAVALTLTALLGKWLAAFLIQLIYKFTHVQRNVLFGLSSAHAAATLAVITVGFEMGLVGTEVLNGTIVLILITCLVASFITEVSGRKLALSQVSEVTDIQEVDERILIYISSPGTIDKLMDFALLLKNPRSKSPVYPLAIVEDDEKVNQKVIVSNMMLQNAEKYASATDQMVHLTTRVDLNVVNGIYLSVRELGITDVVIELDDKVSVADFLFGKVLDNLLIKSPQTLYVCKPVLPFNINKRILAILPPNAVYERGFQHWLRKSILLSEKLGIQLQFYCTENAGAIIHKENSKFRKPYNFSYMHYDEVDDLLIELKNIRNEDLLIIISARRGTISYDDFFDKIPGKIGKHFTYNNLVVIYPEQGEVSDTDLLTLADAPAISPIQENITRLSRLRKSLRNIFSK